MTQDWNSVRFPDLAEFIRESRPTQPPDWWENREWDFRPLYFPAVEPSLLLASEFQPPELPAPGKDPAAELQLSFFETPGFVKTPQGG